MTAQGQHLVFYDGNCGFCQRSVQFLLDWDKDKRFVFAKLQGEIAKEKLADLLQREPDLDSMVLIEDYLTDPKPPRVRAQAVFRACWLLGGFWKLIGWKYLLPAWSIDWAYNFIARHRHHLGLTCALPSPEHAERFLD